MVHYPLVNVYITMENQWKISIFIGKIHYKWSFSIAMLNYQRVVMVESLLVVLMVDLPNGSYISNFLY